MDEKATIYDVADRAGVSTSTVSRVLNGSDKVKRSTQARVRRAIDELDYYPARAAQRLGLRRRKVEVAPPPEAIRKREHLKERLTEEPGRENGCIHFEGSWTPAERDRVKHAVVDVRRAAAPTGHNELKDFWIGLSSQIAGKKIYLIFPLSDAVSPVKAFSVDGLIRRLRALKNQVDGERSEDE